MLWLVVQAVKGSETQERSSKVTWYESRLYVNLPLFFKGQESWKMIYSDRKKLKILFLTRWYPNRYDPMPGLFVKRHAGVVSEFAEVAVIYLHKVTEDLSFRGVELVRGTAGVVSEIIIYYRGTYSHGLINKFSTVIFFLKAWKTAFTTLKKEFGMPDLVHENILTRMGLIALWLKIRHKIPYVVTEHWSRYLPGAKGYRGFCRKWLTRIVVKKACALSSVSMALLTSLKKVGLDHKNSLVIPNFVDTEHFKPSVNMSAKKQILHVSCFEDRSKNISGLLQAVKSISVYRDDFTLLIAGDGVDFDKLKKQSDAIGLTGSKVVFAGLLQENELISAYQSSVCLVLFSNYENMPVVISEAFACGIPVISTNVGGIGENVFNWNGILIEKGDKAALEKAINDMIDNSSFDKAKIREFAVDRFGNEAVTRKLKELYSFAAADF
jgi:glycosyltransferase involved in cell wall biosynthesis